MRTNKKAKKKGIKWWENIDPKKQYPFYIVSIDLTGSSKLRKILEGSFSKTRDSQMFMRELVAVAANRCNGWFFYWAGDGGAVLFDAFGDGKRINQFQALKFALGLYYIGENKLCNWEEINEILKLPDAFKNFKNSIITKLEEYLKSIEIPPAETKINWPITLSTPPSLDNNTYITFRIVCHKGDISVDPKVPSIVYGDDLSFVLKYERELGLKNAISITSQVELDHVKSPLKFCEEHIPIPRRPLNDQTVHIKLFPEGKKTSFIQMQSFLPSAAYLDTTSQEGEDLFVNKIKSFFESPNVSPVAKLYNVGLGTFKTHFTDLWVYLLDRNVKIELMLPEKYLCDKGNVYESKNILKSILIPQIHDNITRYNDLLNKIRVRFVDETILMNDTPAHKYIGKYFGFSLYQSNKNNSPNEGTNFYLIKSFSDWIQFNSVSGYWKYESLFYLMDAYSQKYLNDLHNSFKNTWTVIGPEFGLNEILEINA